MVRCARSGDAALLIQVDGGIGISTAPLVAAAGADVLVCGNAVFNADDPARALAGIAATADEARPSSLAAWEGGVGGMPSVDANDFVYLDYAATAPLCAEAADAMAPFQVPGLRTWP